MYENEDINRLSLSEIVIEALMIDGAHHKQWFLEYLYSQLFGEEAFQRQKKFHLWEEGIAP